MKQSKWLIINVTVDENGNVTDAFLADDLKELALKSIKAIKKYCKGDISNGR